MYLEENNHKVEVKKAKRIYISLFAKKFLVSLQRQVNRSLNLYLLHNFIQISPKNIKTHRYKFF